ncbi:hypothetical protein BGW80DRAFT_1465679 [Lactifluus volemus]|nr:hypothetical protein BGW80DRAFT_1465679 [Lactifluus volemus]
METHTLPPSVTSVAVIVALAVTTTAHAATPHDGNTDMLVIDPSHNSAFSQQSLTPPWAPVRNEQFLCSW